MYEIYGTVLNKYINDGYMETDSDRVWLTDKGIDVSNIILSEFILDR